MSFSFGTDTAAGDAFACDAARNTMIPRSGDIRGVSVRQLLPSRQRRLVGPPVFKGDKIRIVTMAAREASSSRAISPHRDRHDMVPGDEEAFVPLPAPLPTG